ncbi:ATP-dependent helicase wrn-1-like [Branchiostoma lanceolatum]|uniref:ATP-dependent helicase wrn-1-like n=1 Tax=Branchiostoma lanceolatum TaxID=7740 RepID=UPI0034531CD8
MQSCVYSFFLKLYPGKVHLTVVVSPLKSLMLDQEKRWNEMGISSAAVISDMSPETARSVLAGHVRLIFMSPEIILQQPWWGWLRDRRQDICLLAIDEVHCMTTWGASFREGYSKVSSVRSLLSCPILMLTATATGRMVGEVMEQLHLDKGAVEMVSVLPNRPNIHLQVQKCSAELATELAWLLTDLKEKGKDAERTIIYCRTITTVWQVFGWIMKELKDSGMAYTEEPHSVKNQVVDMFHGKTGAASQSRILSRFTERDSSLRCVVATVAFGMGVQVSDIRHVVHWGPSKDILSYWQEVGRCARDGEEGNAKMYVFPRSLDTRFIDARMIALVNSSQSTCIRKTVLEHLFVQGMERNDLSAACNLGSGCCSVCDAKTS